MDRNNRRNDSMANTFQEKLNSILSKSSINEDHSPTSVKPEKGEDITHGNIHGTEKIDATHPIHVTGDSTLKTTATGTDHSGVPTNADLPRPQLDGLDHDNKNPGTSKVATKKYVVEEGEGSEDSDKDMSEEKEEDKKLPPFMKKKDSKKSDKKDDKEDKSEKDEKDEKKDDKKSEKKSDKKKDLKEAEEALSDKADAPGKSGKDANVRAGYSKVMKEDAKDGDPEKEKVEEAKEEEKDKEVVKESLTELFNGEVISEALKVKAATIFESALSNRIKEYRKAVNTKLNAKLNSRVEEIRSLLTEKVEGHLDLVVESWIKTNQMPLENTLKLELSDNIINGLKNLLEQNNIDIPNDKVDVVTELTAKLEKLENKLNEQIDVNANLKNTVKQFEKEKIFEEVSNGLTDIQKQNLRSISEGVDYKSDEDYKTNLNSLKKNLNVSKSNKKEDFETTVLNESIGTSETKEALLSPEVDAVKKHLSRMASSK
jgi:hypothetical protein